MTRWATPVLSVALVVLAGCSTVEEVAVPAGWQAWEAGGLHGAHPASWQAPVPEQRGWPAATLEVAGPATGQPLGPVMAVFAESGEVPTVDERATLITARLESELAAELAERTVLQVPGTAEGVALEFRFDAEAPGSADPVASRQVEVILLADDGRTFDMLLGGPVDQLDQTTVDGVLGSLRVR